MAQLTPIDGFAWTSESWGPALRSTALGRAADHFFTTRQLWLRGDGEAEDWRRVAATIGVPPACLLRLTQVHGRAVFVHRNDAGTLVRESHPAAGVPAGAAGEAAWPQADIAITDDPAVALAVQAADCVPLLMADPETGAVAAVHAGWRGAAAGAACAAVEALRLEFGVAPARLVAALGPSIGPCCYDVGEELIEAFRAGGFSGDADRWFIRRDGRALTLDVRAANRDQLIWSGVRAGAVHESTLCTADRPDLFASYRRDGPGTGRIAAVIRSRGRRFDKEARCIAEVS